MISCSSSDTLLKFKFKFRYTVENTYNVILACSSSSLLKFDEKQGVHILKYVVLLIYHGIQRLISPKSTFSQVTIPVVMSSNYDSKL